MQRTRRFGQKHECRKHFRNVCLSNRQVGHLCYMQLLKNVLPSSNGVLYVFYDFETTQNTRYFETAKVYVRTWSAYSSSVRGARALRIVNGIANGVEITNPRSGMIAWVTSSRTSTNRDPVSGRYLRLHITPGLLIYISY